MMPDKFDEFANPYPADLREPDLWTEEEYEAVLDFLGDPPGFDEPEEEGWQFHAGHDNQKVHGRRGGGGGSGLPPLSQKYTPSSVIDSLSTEDIKTIYSAGGEFNVRVISNGDSFTSESHYDERGNYISIRTRNIYVNLTDGGGNEVARMMRVFKEDGSIEHHSFKVSDTEQGNGIAGKVNNTAEKYYKEMGFKKVSLLADIDVGKYAWAKQGYEFSGTREEKHEWLTAGFMRVVHPNGLQKRFDYAGAKKMADTLVDKPMKDIAGAVSHDGEQFNWSTYSKKGTGNLGKALLLAGSGWPGEKTL